MHKLAHKKRDEKIEQGFKYTGPLRPHPYSFVPVIVRMTRPDTGLITMSLSEISRIYLPGHHLLSWDLTYVIQVVQVVIELLNAAPAPVI